LWNAAINSNGCKTAMQGPGPNQQQQPRSKDNQEKSLKRVPFLQETQRAAFQGSESGADSGP
jgi:hypothetical protein